MLAVVVDLVHLKLQIHLSPSIIIVTDLSVKRNASLVLRADSFCILWCYFVDSPIFTLFLVLTKSFFYIVNIDICVAEGTFMIVILYLGFKPFIDAFRVEDVLADWDLPDGYTLNEFFEADYTFDLLEAIYSSIIRSFSD